MHLKAVSGKTTQRAEWNDFRVQYLRKGGDHPVSHEGCRDTNCFERSGTRKKHRFGIFTTECLQNRSFQRQFEQYLVCW